MEKTFEDLRVDDVDAFADDVFDFIEAAGGFPTGIEPEQMADIEDIFREG